MAEVMIGMEDDDSNNENRIIRAETEEEYKYLLICQKRFREQPLGSSEEEYDSGNPNRIIRAKSEEEYIYLLFCQIKYRKQPLGSSEEEYHLLAYIQEEYMQLKQKDQYFGRKEFFKALLFEEEGHDELLYETSPREFRVKGFPPDDTSQENLDEELEKKIKEDLKNLESILKKKKEQKSADYDFEDFNKDVLRERDIRPAAENQNHKSEIKALKKALVLSLAVIVFLIVWITIN